VLESEASVFSARSATTTSRATTLNEGHAALLALQLLEDERRRPGVKSIRSEDIEKVRSKWSHNAYSGARWTRPFPHGIPHAGIPDETQFLDLKTFFRGFDEARLQAEQNFPDLQEAARRGASLNMTQLR